jgi:hypothetical protein
MPDFLQPTKDVLNSPPGKFLRAMASVFTLTAAVAIKSAAVMAKFSVDMISAGSSKWIQNVFTGQSTLFNAHNAFFVTLSDFFGSIGDKAVDVGTYGFKYAGQMVRDNMLSYLNEGGFGDTAGDDMDMRDLHATAGADNYEQFTQELKRKKAKENKTDKWEKRMLLKQAFMTIDEWLAQGATLVKKDALGQVKIEDMTPAQEAEYQERMLGWLEKGLQNIDVMLVANLTSGSKEDAAEQNKISKAVNELFDVAPDGQKKLKDGVTFDQALVVVEGMCEALTRSVQREEVAAGLRDPGKSPKDPESIGPLILGYTPDGQPIYQPRAKL